MSATAYIIGATGASGGTNAGTTSANGTYIQVTGANSTYNGGNQYTNGTCFLVDNGSGWGCFTGVNATGTLLYTQAGNTSIITSAATMIISSGASPAPTVAIVTPSLSTTGYVVTGAGTAAVNGTYLPLAGLYSTVNGPTQYSNGTYYITYSGIIYTIGYLNNVSGGTAYYIGGTGATTMQLTTWSVSIGVSPGPTLSIPAAPTAPSALTLVDNTPTSINVTIPALSGGATSYLLQRAPDVSGSPGTYTTLNGGSAVTPSTVYSDTSLTSGAVYWYMLVGVNGYGSTNGVGSSITELPASPAALTLTVISSSQINITIPTLASVTGAVTFNLQRAPDVSGSPGTYTTIAPGVTPNTTYTDTGLSANTTYHYRLLAVDSGGPTNGSDSYATTTPSIGTLVPTGVTATYIANTGILVSWTSPTNYSPIGYNVYRLATNTLNGIPQRLDEAERQYISSTSLLDVRLGIGLLSQLGSNQYVYYVTAINANGIESPFSTVSSTVSFIG